MVEIASFDPGLTIGICTLDDRRFRANQITPMNYPHPHEALYDLLSNLKPELVLYERFDFRAAKNGVVLKGVEFIGILELYAQTRCIEAISISASDGKAFWNNDKLKALGIYTPGRPHAMDATRIMLAYLMKNDEAFRKDAIERLRVKT